MMKKSFWYNSDQNGDLLKPRTGHGQYVVDIDNMLFAISGLSNCTVSTYRVYRDDDDDDDDKEQVMTGGTGLSCAHPDSII